MIPTLSEADIVTVLKYEQLIPGNGASARSFLCRPGDPTGAQYANDRSGKAIAGHHARGGRDRNGRQALVCFYPKNAGTATPTHLAMIMLYEPETGQPLAFMDGRLITEMRTVAVSAAVTRHLMLPDSKALALVGSGVQARAHLETLRHVCQFEEIRVWSRTPGHAQRFAAMHGARAMDLEPAVRGADVIVTATNSLEPLLRGEWPKPGAHVNAVGSPRPTWRELDDVAMRNVLIVDSREAVLKESGDVILSKAPIFAEAGEIFAGGRVVRRTDTTVFKSVGIAVEDIATARLVYDAVTSEGRGH